MKDFFNDSEDSQNDGMTKEDKIQILIKVIPVLLIIIILLIMLLVNHSKQQGSEESQQDTAVEENSAALPAASDAIEASTSPQPAASGDTNSSDGSETTAESQKSASDKSNDGNAEDEVFDFSGVTFNTEDQLQEMMTYWEQGNQEALDDLANLDRFRAMSYELKNTDQFYYLGETDEDGKPSGTGIAVYADNQYYYGSWKNGVRDGEGRWMHYHIHASSQSNDVYLFHQYSGNFKNDLPDGEGSEHYDFVTSRLKEKTRYYSNFIGTYKQGYLNGDFYITTIDKADNFEEWNATAKMGSFEYLSKNKDQQGKGPTMVDTEDEKNFIWMSDEENQGWSVKCYISANK